MKYSWGQGVKDNETSTQLPIVAKPTLYHNYSWVSIVNRGYIPYIVYKAKRIHITLKKILKIDKMPLENLNRKISLI